MINNRQMGDYASITLPHFTVTVIIFVNNVIKGNKTARLSKLVTFPVYLFTEDNQLKVLVNRH